ncbi:MAG TPA: hypothetical protein VGE08_23360 [Steroidobacter sp.]|uniref:hypothetical protein n=1 Tax=Steroidobacter sp. TaxID=1978227 RepID=UPI002ED93459
MKTLTSTVTLIVPELNPPDQNPLGAEHEAGTGRLPPLTRLARLAGRGSVLKRQIEAGRGALHAAVLDALQLRDAADQYPSAAVIRTGATGERAIGFWLRAQPIHFAAGLDRLTTIPLHGAARMSAAERAALSPTLADHLQSTGIQLHEGADGEWLLRSEEPLQVQTVTPEFAAENPRADILPTGRDAGSLRRLMTEMQMLLHDHPVNRSRERRGLPAMNAIWVHGEGMLSDVTPQSLPEASGDDVYLQGIYRLHGLPVQPKSADAASLLTRIAGPTVAIIDPPDLRALETNWLEPLSRALLRGAISNLTVLFDGWRIDTDRAAMFKFWRRPLPPANWAAC